MIKNIKRLLLDNLKNSKKSILLIGPRQSGKSTLLKQLNPNIEINLADEAQFLRISSEIDYFTSLIEDKKIFL